MGKSKLIIIKGFYTNLSESDITNILIDDFHIFETYFPEFLKDGFLGSKYDPGRFF